MPTNRTRRRRGGNSIPLDVWALFAIGCGWNVRDQDEIRQLWAKHGRAFLRQYNHEGEPWALMMLGEPENYT